MNDKIIIEGLKIQCVIGDYDWERERPQTILLGLELECDCKPAAKKDALTPESADYARVAKEVLAFTEKSTFRLIETLAEGIAELCLRSFPIRAVTVRAGKPNAIGQADIVWVEIKREVPYTSS